MICEIVTATGQYGKRQNILRNCLPDRQPGSEASLLRNLLEGKSYVEIRSVALHR